MRVPVNVLGVPVCPSCGFKLTITDARVGMCSHHTPTVSDTWAKENRVACDFFHRQIVHPATLEDRIEDEAPAA